jgi:SAM-dependent methyltransferase
VPAETLTRLAAKARSARFKLRTRAYRRSVAWEANPLHPERVGLPPDEPGLLERLLRDMAPVLGYAFEDVQLDPAAYQRFRARFPMPRLYAVGYKDKKALEHFIAFTQLDLGPGQTYVDIGSEGSPYPRLFRRIGVWAFSQDLAYRPGVHGWRIGSSADRLPLDERSVDRISLQCAFEHFEGSADGGFIRELSRVLRPGGRCVIVPLYLSNTFRNIVDPLLAEGVEFDEGSARVAETDLGGRFERLYSPASLSRIVRPGLGLTYTLCRVANLDALVGTGPSAARRVNYFLRVDRER